jgi:hypothetical protein
MKKNQSYYISTKHIFSVSVSRKHSNLNIFTPHNKHMTIMKVKKKFQCSLGKDNNLRFDVNPFSNKDEKMKHKTVYTNISSIADLDLSNPVTKVRGPPKICSYQVQLYNTSNHHDPIYNY